MAPARSENEQSPISPEHEGNTIDSKKRWRRNRVACDACHARRVRCDRAFPCTRCVRGRIQCELTRERRKRGRIPRKDSRLSTADAVSNTDRKKTSDNPVDAVITIASPLQNESPTSNFHRSPRATDNILPASAPSIEQRSVADPQTSPKETVIGGNISDDWMSTPNGLQPPCSYDLFGNVDLTDAPFSVPFEMMGTAEIGGYQLPRSVSRQRINPALGSATTEPPLKYPVLQPLVPFLEPYLSRNLAYDLLELYFTSAFSTLMHPVCHHIHCYVVRKASFLSRDNPRTSSPALLASMLWVAALDDRAFALSISPMKRRKICQFLCALTVRLLRPLIHVAFKGEDVTMGENDYTSPNATHDGAARTHSFEEGGDDRGLVGPAGCLDDIITYIHVASIVSASEQKAASMRW
jgi:hypothetical protein